MLMVVLSAKWMLFLPTGEISVDMMGAVKEISRLYRGIETLCQTT